APTYRKTSPPQTVIGAPWYTMPEEASRISISTCAGKAVKPLAYRSIVATPLDCVAVSIRVWSTALYSLKVGTDELRPCIETLAALGMPTDVASQNAWPFDVM